MSGISKRRIGIKEPAGGVTVDEAVGKLAELFGGICGDGGAGLERVEGFGVGEEAAEDFSESSVWRYFSTNCLGVMVGLVGRAGE